MATAEQLDNLPGTLSSWLGQLGTEVAALSLLAQCGQADRGARQFAHRALRYWAHCIELPIDGIEDLRLMDIALVLRTLADFSGSEHVSLDTAVSSAASQGDSQPDHAPPLDEPPAVAAASSESSQLVAEEGLGLVAKLRADAERVRQLLGEDYGSLARYASQWVEQHGAGVEGPPASTEGQSLEQRAEQWGRQYEPPPCAVDANTLIKVQAFARARYAEG